MQARGRADLEKCVNFAGVKKNAGFRQDLADHPINIAGGVFAGSALRAGGEFRPPESQRPEFAVCPAGRIEDPQDARLEPRAAVHKLLDALDAQAEVSRCNINFDERWFHASDLEIRFPFYAPARRTFWQPIGDVGPCRKLHLIQFGLRLLDGL